MTKRDELESARSFLLGSLPAESRVLCAVSGGLDSMCLLHLMCKWGREQNFIAAAAHFNHRLRGVEADRDEAFVRDWCGRNGVPFFSERGDVRAFAEAESLSLEEAARHLRYEFLERTAAQERCAAILTAHHADDNAETVLLNLIRGTGLRGLCGIPPEREQILRPFLRISRAELGAYAAAHQIPHVEDATNADPDAAARNLLRLKVMPLLREINPRAVEHVNRTAGILTAESDALETMAKRLASQAKETDAGFTLPCLLLTEAPAAVAQRAVLCLLGEAAGRRGDFTAAHVTAVLDLIREGRMARAVSLPYGLTARRGRYALEIVRAAPPPKAVPLDTAGGVVSFGSWTVSLAGTPGIGMTYALSFPENTRLTVTPWHPRDRLCLPGSRGCRSLKRLCADCGVPPWQREALPVLRADDQAAAVPFLGIHADFAPEREKKPVYVTFYKQTEENKHEK